MFTNQAHRPVRAGLVGFAVVGLLCAVGLTRTASAEAKSGETVIIQAQDRCEPVTFNAAIPNICLPTPEGTVTFTEFLDKLNPHDFGHRAWRFSRDDVTIKAGDTLRVKYVGGEAHSFSRVTKFGAGCVDELNGPLGLTKPGTSCPAAFADVRGPGADEPITGLTRGTYRFQCVIHPWMRTTVHVE